MAYQEIPIPSGSSNVQSVSYDPDSGNLQVRFIRSERPYTYFQVPINVANGFTTSGMSAGIYLNTAIKGQYVFE